MSDFNFSLFIPLLSYNVYNQTDEQQHYFFFVEKKIDFKSRILTSFSSQKYHTSLQHNVFFPPRLKVH